MQIEGRGLGQRVDRRWILKDVSLKLEEGGISILMGPNGAGKTTLLKILGLLDAPREGELLVDGRLLAGFSSRQKTELRRRMGFVFQHPLLLRGSVIDNLRFGLKLRRQAPSAGRLDEVLEGVGLAARRDLDAERLSGGEKQRLQLARAIILQPQLLLADEPTANLDPLSARFIEERLLEMARSGRTVILSTHYALQALQLGTHVFFMEKGRLVQQGMAREVMESPATLEVARYSPMANVLFGRMIREDAELLFITGSSRIHVVSPFLEGPAAAILRPEEIIVSGEPLHSSARNSFSGEVVDILDLGMIVVVRVACPDFTLRVFITRRSMEEMRVGLGSRVWLTIKATAVSVVSAE